MAAAALLAQAAPLQAAPVFGFEDVASRAKALASKPYVKPSANPPKELKTLSYDQYRDIRYRTDRFLWRGTRLPFEVAFFHRGFFFDRPVRINEVTGEGVREIAFDPDDFDYGSNKIDPRRMKDAGFAGFRVHFPVNTPQYKDEVLVFLGASYFRALGRGQRYGASGRGLAIDTAASSGEQFPHFTEFWIKRPTEAGKELVVYALLDSRSATGAYRFVLRPGTATIMDVRARLHLRENVGKLGIAPLTSMFMFGENQRSATDYRPEVHDSDGLSVQTGTGEWIWRPLVNPRRLLVTSFSMTDPAGFGLMQRDRAFTSYEDLEARYELRPSVWIAPRGKWGAGRVELVQIPTPDETNDNIVAFWVPAAPAAAGQVQEYEYRLLWQKDTETRPSQSWVVQTRRGTGYMRKPDRTIGFIIDFEGPALAKLAPGAPVEGMFSADGNGAIVESIAYRNDVTGGWRVSLRLRRSDDKKPVELRGFLRHGTETISETWSYVLPPE